MSTRTAATARSPWKGKGSERPGSLTGTGVLLRFMLRRDRLRLPAWVLGISALMAYFANAIGELMGDEESLASMAALATNPVIALIGGPGYGLDEITVPRFLAAMYGLYLMLAAAFMSITTISRHTRVEEQTGRAELLRASVLGRHAQLTAALIMATAMNLLVALLSAALVMGSVIEPSPDAQGSLLFGFSIGAAGLAFAGVAAVTVQLSAFSRAGSGIAGAVLGTAFVIRGLGDMSFVAQGEDGALAWLSWLSPLGWAQQTAPYTLDRWWPLLLSVVFALLLAAVGYSLQSRRDLAAGILPDRLGSARAAAWLAGPLPLALRLQRSSLIGWTAGLLIAGVAFGGFTDAMIEGVAGMPEEIAALMGGSDGIVEGYQGFMGLYFAIMVAVFVILAAQGLRSEEQGVRTEPILATGVSRARWLLSWAAVAAGGSAWLLLVAGFGQGLGASLSTGDWSLLGPVILGHVVHVAPVWFLLGLALALYGWVPRLTGVAWAVFGFGTLLALFGPMLDVGQAVLNASPFDHVGQYPSEAISWTAVAILGGTGVLLVLGAVAGFRRRDLTTA
ncbi:ABC transporter permease [Bogoriella caseilytica]|uniref:ABC-2 type transport system permease protein n=1 Tax=Bogoriella caseilytica TaxID=56055 RepID=A0A3N2BBU8_9MICO|nr:ABC transporter permease [Bogoriella caseilytica]ROR72739.1 ABC-2 type transport system permease protein [Bogoriella caseilytica]